MALISHGVGLLIVFTVLSFEFHQVIIIALTLSPMTSGSCLTELSDLGAILESYRKLQQNPKTVPELKCTSVDLVCLTGESH